MKAPKISVGRAAVALLCCAFLGSAVAGIYAALATTSPVLGILVWVFSLVIAVPSALIIGLPTCLLLRALLRPSVRIALLAGDPRVQAALSALGQPTIAQNRSHMRNNSPHTTTY